jgi:hypothetical protein
MDEAIAAAVDHSLSLNMATVISHDGRQLVTVKLPPKRGGIDYKESHAREAEDVRRCVPGGGGQVATYRL